MPRPSFVNVLAASLSSVLLLAACGGGTKAATDDDKARALAACKAKKGYEPKKSADVLSKVDAHCGSDCAFRPALAAVCTIDTKSDFHFEVYTTIAKNDVAKQDELCDTLRAHGDTGATTDIFVFCKEGNSACTRCGGPGAGR